jgi:23S rRNA pseudouridine1911/1915/1917 synthase
MPPEHLVATPGRLDAVLAGLTGRPRADVQRAIATGLVTVDGSLRPKSFRLGGGESITYSSIEPGSLEPEGPPVQVLYEDEDLAIVSKPAGVATHPTATRRTGTLVNRLLGMGMSLAPAGGPLRPGIVHRLDIGTSGLMIVAKTDQAYDPLSAMMKRHDVRRTYLALVRGVAHNATFSIDAPLSRRAERIVVDRTQGREARTDVRVLTRFARSTLVAATPLTGRTHQIRVHLAAVGHPIEGDRTYGGGGDHARELGLHRPFLHSNRIAFEHPLTADTIRAEDPLPSDLADALVIAERDQRP